MYIQIASEKIITLQSTSPVCCLVILPQILLVLPATSQVLESAIFQPMMTLLVRLKIRILLTPPRI